MSEPLQYSIVVVKEADKDKVLAHLYSNFFLDEPLSESLGIVSGPESRCPPFEAFATSSIPQGMSLMAVDAEGKVLGVRMSEVLTREKGGKKAPDHEAKIESCEDPKFKVLWEAIDYVYWKKNVFDLYPKINECLGFKVLSVDRAHRNKGIAKALLQKAIELARSRNIPLVRVDCTSAYSAKAMLSVGFTLIHTLPYKEYLDSKGRQIFTPSPPHVALTTFIKPL